MPEVYLSDKQLAARWSVHYLTPRRWVKDDPTFPQPIKLTPGTCRWKLSDIEAWEASKTDNAA